MTKYIYLFLIVSSNSLFGCTENTIDDSISVEPKIENNNAKDSIKPNQQKKYKMLALGDSYTIGQGVCTTCSFPEQLKSKIETEIENSSINLKIIAKTGWTTTNLMNNIPKKLSTDYDFVTLLIGVNNQYQRVNFDVYKKEFPELVNKAIKAVKGDKTKLVVISIPDYAYTPFGNGNIKISEELKIYNSFAKEYCKSNSIQFLNITDITENGLNQPELVANDNLHPSKIAYKKFVERLFPLFL